METKSQNPYLIPGAIVVAGIIIAGAVFYSQNLKLETLSPVVSTGNETPSAFPLESSKVEITVTEKDHIRGNPEAPVTIVEYSDFQCPFCQAFHPTLKQILEDYPNQVLWVYKHFPLDQIHPQARPAAEASECVAEQKGNDGFWQFADSLFENQERLSPDLYRELAGNLGVDMARFEECVDSRKYQERVEAGLQEGINFGVLGTPGSFVNGEELAGAVSYSTVKAAVERALSQ